MADPVTPTQVQIDDKAGLDSWLRDTLHPADNTTLHVHFLDYDTPRDLTELYTALDDATRKKPSVDSPSTSSIVDKLVKDIRALCLFTDGVLMSWSGRKMTPGNDDGESPLGTANPTATSKKDDGKSPQHIYLHKMFSKLMKDDNVKDFRDGRSAVVTLPHASQEGGVASPCTHQLMLTSKDTNLMQDTRQTLLTTSVREGVTRPVVCVLVGGDTESLKTAVTAVINNIPVIVMKGSGGFADLLAWLYEKAKLEYRRQRVPQAKQVKTVTVRVVDKDTMDMITDVFEGKPDIMESLATLIKHLHLLTVYNPRDIPTSQDPTAVTTQANGNMDAAILEALIRHNQDSKIAMFLMTMKRRQKRVHAPPPTYSQTVVENETLQLDCFIDCLLSRSPAAVSAFLTHLKPNFFDFHLGRLLRLYEADVRFLRSDMLTEEGRDKPFARFQQARRDLKSYTGSVSRFPLKCCGDYCKDCSLGYSEDDRAYPMQDGPSFLMTCEDPMQESKSRFLQTCLHPVQELFLWSLLSGDLYLAVTLWTYCEDKMAAALFARGVFLGMIKEEKNNHVKKELNANCECFADLAINMVKTANEVDEKKTRDLINQPCYWWGSVSVLEIAVLTKSISFIAQEPCLLQLTSGGASNGTVGQKTEQQQYHAWPRFRYGFTLVWQMAFLVLYSYVLLFDLRDIPSPAFIALMVWVADISCVELQGLSMNRGAPSTRVKTYWSQKWNKLDVVSVAGFVLGVTLILAPSQHVQRVGRVVLAADVFVFYLRSLQMLVVFRELGLLIVIAEKMVMDSVRFMVILLTVMLGYVVASESVLYPDMKFSWPTLYHLPYKAFWQTFGEFGLDEIQGDNCEKDGPCSLIYEQYVVSLMLALYVLVSQVLLLNLLIAMFNTTFQEVKDEAGYHQARMLVQVSEEFRHGTFLPPPCNLLRFLIPSVIQRNAKEYLCCQGSQRSRGTNPGTRKGDSKPLINMKAFVFLTSVRLPFAGPR